ncbi:hypothetical protein FVEN_g12312 [Fusarium venenatum]|uniref:Uncharacterized protein n=1 Tax=Fusarium venenatum TaxID=56646 RepID=A0A2L2TUQ5_9HYPO|nr:uncharacterized protein FVRRES_01692 [Fusarium venenatum]KAG8349476.1 hypothetical protein FVEN_g12312 [Fusarium venenatum]KAH7005151.1 hypothetical protein EDB82DRAFT_71044 [Fusarium venenatum]CEI65180.1 unnamed protein product [Fusarium venenatum]
MVLTTITTDHLSLDAYTGTARLALQRPKAPNRRHSAKPKHEDEDPIYDLMALPQPTHVPAVAPSSCKPPYDLSPNALAGNQNRVERRGRPRLDSSQTKNSEQDKQKDLDVVKNARASKKSTIRGKRAEKQACSSTNNGNPINHGLFDLDIANQMIPYCSPDLITTCPKPPTPAGMCDSKTYLSYQIDIARHLAYNGVSGPYRVGEYLCDLYLADAKFIKIASLNIDTYGQSFWCHTMTGERVHSQDGSKVAGKPVTMANGALVWMEDEKGNTIPPEWSFTEPHDLFFEPQVIEFPSTVPLQQRYPGLRSGNNPTLL